MRKTAAAAARFSVTNSPPEKPAAGPSAAPASNHCRPPPPPPREPQKENRTIRIATRSLLPNAVIVLAAPRTLSRVRFCPCAARPVFFHRRRVQYQFLRVLVPPPPRPFRFPDVAFEVSFPGALRTHRLARAVISPAADNAYPTPHANVTSRAADRFIGFFRPRPKRDFAAAAVRTTKFLIMAGKKKIPTKTVSKKTTKPEIEEKETLDILKKSEVIEEPLEVNGTTDVEEPSEPDVVAKTNGKETGSKRTARISTNTARISTNTARISTNTARISTNTARISTNTARISIKMNVDDSILNDKQAVVKSKRKNQSNEDEKQHSNAVSKKSIAKPKLESENMEEATSSTRSKRKSVVEPTTEVKRKKTEKTPDKIAVDNRIETSGVVMIKGRDIVIAGLFGLGPDREQITNLTELKNFKFKLIVAGSMHVLGVTEDGKLMSWGCNDEGALGRDTSVEDSETRPGIVQIPEENPEIYSISAGGSHSAILLSNGNVYSWGTFRDRNGDMGFHPNGDKQLTPKLIMKNVKKIASGINHLVMLSKNNVYTMGCGDEGQLGRVCQKNSNRESRVGKKLLLNPQLLNLRKKVEDIWADYDTTFLRLSDSTIYSFGLNAHGQLGVENDDKCVYFPQMSESLSRLKIKSISAGTQHVTLLDEQGAVYVLGDYKDGRLGMDIAEIQKVPKILSSLPQIKLATCGSDNSFVVTENNKLMAWGIGFEEKDDSDVIYYTPTDIDAANKLDQKKIVQATSSDTAVFLLIQD